MLSKVDNIYYMFLDKLSIAGNDRLRIKRTSGSESNIGISKTPFENGKYYYFNDITNSFDVPPNGTRKLIQSASQVLIFTV